MTGFKVILATLLVGSAVLLSREANAQISDRTLRWAQQNSLEHPQGQGAKKFAELVEQKSGGKIKIRIFPSGQLGGDLQNVSALQGGTLDLMVMNAGLLVGVVKDFAVVDLPFLFNTPEEADAVVDGPVGKKLFDKLPEKNLVGLGYFELGFRNVTNSKRPITKLEDFQGLRLRVLQSPLFVELFNTLGANTVPLPFPELYTALEQKVVDGQENPVTVILDSKFQEVQKFL
ncbi:MAG TPA: DctP family TRAP transporter solute-binding subunit, partial [Microvirga sp.]|nr:DctP family TRAP transporter solute-binding subunit [Microvirga sp.]